MQFSSAELADQGRKGIAPVWHTCIFIAIFVALGIGEMGRSRHAASPRALPFYLSAIVFEWLLFAFVWWGIRLRRYPLSALISQGRSRFKRDAVFGIGIWVCWYVVESLVAAALAAAGITNRGAPGTVFPHSPAQIMLWIIMAASSGCSEEIAFRGYLLQQFSRWTGSTTIGILIQAILFGFGHAYLGTRQAVLIMVSGALLGIFAAWLRSLRPVMITHAWADIFGGIIVHGLPYK